MSKLDREHFREMGRKGGFARAANMRAAKAPAEPLNGTVLDAMRIIPGFEGASWDSWRTVLRALDGLPLEPGDLERWHELTQRPEDAPLGPFTEAYFVAGRRSGKSRIAALLSVHRACFKDWRPYLAHGERATVMVLAANRQQSRIVFRYVDGMIHAVPELKRLLKGKPKQEQIELTCGVNIEIHTASKASVRGYSLAACICDEICFWDADESGANPDVAVLEAVVPGLATLRESGSMLLALSSPYSRRGALFRAYERHYGQPSNNAVVIQAPTLSLNPTLAESVITDARERDAVAAEAEWDAQWRRDIEAFLSIEAVEAVVDRSRPLELAPVSNVRYYGFCDASGGSQDAFSCGIAHAEKRGETTIAVLDVVRERRPPFSPDAVVQEYAALLKAYHCHEVTGDKYAGEWPRERFRAHGIEYRVADKTRSDYFLELLAPVHAERVRLPDHKTLTKQLVGLERKVQRSGKDSITHGPNGKDDTANAAAGALVLALKHEQTGLNVTPLSFMRPFGELVERRSFGIGLPFTPP